MTDPNEDALDLTKIPEVDPSNPLDALAKAMQSPGAHSAADVIREKLQEEQRKIAEAEAIKTAAEEPTVPPELDDAEEPSGTLKGAISEEMQKRLQQMQEEAEPQTATEVMSNLSDWLDSLVPDERWVTVIDHAEEEHDVLVLASAEKQIRVGRKIRNVLGKHVEDDVELNEGSLASILLELVQDEEVFDVVEYAFTTLCRSALRKARLGEAAKVAKLDMEDHNEDLVDAGGKPIKIPTRFSSRQLFPIEEMIAGVVPFSGRLIRRVAGWMDKKPNRVLIAEA